MVRNWKNCSELFRRSMFPEKSGYVPDTQQIKKKIKFIWNLWGKESEYWLELRKFWMFGAKGTMPSLDWRVFCQLDSLNVFLRFLMHPNEYIVLKLTQRIWFFFLFEIVPQYMPSIENCACEVTIGSHYSKFYWNVTYLDYGTKKNLCSGWWGKTGDITHRVKWDQKKGRMFVNDLVG